MWQPLELAGLLQGAGRGAGEQEPTWLACYLTAYLGRTPLPGQLESLQRQVQQQGIPVSTAPAVQVGLCQLLLLLHQAVSATRARAGLSPSTPLYSDTLQPTDPAAVAQLLADSMAQYRAHKYNILAVQI